MESERSLALKIIHNARLRHPDLPLVESFIYDAKDGNKAAKYLLHACKDGTTGGNFSQFVEDWKSLVSLFCIEKPPSSQLDRALKKTIQLRDGYRCCITGTRSRLWHSYDVFPIIPLSAFFLRQKRQHDILGAFTTPSHRDLLLHFNREINPENVSLNHWTLCKEAAQAFSTGEIQLQHVGGAEYEILYNNIGGKPPAFYTPQRAVDWECDLSDCSKSGIKSPDPKLLEIHSLFSKALKWTSVATNMKRHANPRQTNKATCISMLNPMARNILAIWLTFPDTIRLQAYKVLKVIGSYIYEPSIAMMGVQRLPFGLYLKYGPVSDADRHTREYKALHLIRNSTSIPAPYPIDLILSANESIMITTRIDGKPAGVEIDTCSDEELSLMAQDLHGWIAELHSIRRPTDSNYAICGISGGACFDYRIGSEPAGPFRDERELSEALRLGILPNLVHRDDHNILFAHGDLNMRNILVKDGRISGIVDWENAGWYPEYWEYTKCHFGVRLHKRWLRMIEEVFGDQYHEELMIERQYWMYQTL